jgi:hypothetical protein
LIFLIFILFRTRFDFSLRRNGETFEQLIHSISALNQIKIDSYNMEVLSQSLIYDKYNFKIIKMYKITRVNVAKNNNNDKHYITYIRIVTKFEL